MNTPIYPEELDPSERKQRASQQRTARRLARVLGFEETGAKGFWHHPELDPMIPFELTGQFPAHTQIKILEVVYARALQVGRADQRSKLKEALGL